MKSHLLIGFAAMLIVALPASARPPRAIVEDGHEVTPAMLTLPAQLDGTLAIQGCTACKRLTYTLSREVRFFIGEREVNFADLRSHLRANPNVNVLVVTPYSQNVVTRISASLPPVQGAGDER